MQINDIFHNCPEQQEQQEQQQSDPKDLGSKFPRSKMRGLSSQHLLPKIDTRFGFMYQPISSANPVLLY